MPSLKQKKRGHLGSQICFEGQKCHEKLLIIFYFCYQILFLLYFCYNFYYQQTTTCDQKQKTLKKTIIVLFIVHLYIFNGHIIFLYDVLQNQN